MTGKTLHSQKELKRISWLEQEMVNYVFHCVRTTWGAQKFKQFFGGDDSEVNSFKRDWKKAIALAVNIQLRPNETDNAFINRAKQRIDGAFLDIRRQQDATPREWDFPDIRKVCAFLSNYRGSETVREIDIDRHQCSANGCPLPGGHVHGERQLCRFHERLKSAKDFDATTTKIRKHQSLITFHAELIRLGPLCWQQHRTPCPDGLEIKRNEGWSDYVSRVNAELHQKLYPKTERGGNFDG